MNGVVAAILVGGESRRMGSDKALFPVAGRPMVRWVAKAAHAVASRVMAIGRSRPVGGVPAVPDLEPSHRGALAGLVTALDHASPEGVLLLAVDQPFVRSNTLRRLLARSALLPVVPVDQGVLQVTCAFYPASLRMEAARELDAGGSIQSLLQQTRHDPIPEEIWKSWSEDGRSWYSVDTTEALAEGLRRYGSPG